MSTDATPTKFAAFLKDKKVDPRRILTASHKLESLQPQDREIRLNKRKARNTEDDSKKGPPETRKARSGRPVTSRAIEAAMAGKPVSGPVKTRILRAINAVLEQKKLEKIDLRAIF
jgi:hypothetical protein